jgi:hypothetical protein
MLLHILQKNHCTVVFYQMHSLNLYLYSNTATDGLGRRSR